MGPDETLQRFPVQDLPPEVADYVNKLDERNERLNKEINEANMRTAEVENFVCEIADILSEQTSFSIEKSEGGYMYGYKKLTMGKRIDVLMMLGMLVDRSKRF